MKNHLASWAESSPFGVFARILIFSFAFVLVVVIIDFFRQKLFRLLGVQNWGRKLSGMFRKNKVS